MKIKTRRSAATRESEEQSAAITELFVVSLDGATVRFTADTRDRG